MGGVEAIPPTVGVFILEGKILFSLFIPESTRRLAYVAISRYHES